MASINSAVCAKKINLVALVLFGSLYTMDAAFAQSLWLGVAAISTSWTTWLTLGPSTSVENLYSVLSTTTSSRSSTGTSSSLADAWCSTSTGFPSLEPLANQHVSTTIAVPQRTPITSRSTLDVIADDLSPAEAPEISMTVPASILAPENAFPLAGAHETFVAMPVPTSDTSGILDGSCAVFDPQQQLQPICTTTHSGDEYHTNFTTTCSADTSLPLTCAALSLFHSRATQPQPQYIHNYNLADQSQPTHVSTHVHNNLYFYLSLLQTVSTVWALAKYYLTPKRIPQCAERGPRQAFGGVRNRLAKSAPQRKTLRSLLPASPPPLQHIVPSSPQQLLQGGAPPQTRKQTQHLLEGGAPDHDEVTTPRRKARLPTLFDPDETLSPHCLFASVLHTAGIDVTIPHILQLRAQVHGLLEDAYLHNKLVAGHTVGHWARLAGKPTLEYIAATTEGQMRRGNTTDAYLCALLLGTSIWVYDSNGDLFMASHPIAPACAIQHCEDHFRAVHHPWAREDLQQPPELECMSERLSDLPLSCLGKPRTTEMIATLRRHVVESSTELYQAKQFYHSHYPANRTHVRVAILVPTPHCPLDEQDNEPKRALVIMNGMPYIRTMPSWMAMVRLVMEIEVSDPPTMQAMIINTQEVIEKTDVILHNRVEHLLDSVLGPHEEIYDDLHSRCLKILDLSISEHPRICRRFIHSLQFHINTQPQPVTFNEYLAMCRRHQPASTAPVYIVHPQPDNYNWQPFERPVVLLRQEQVSAVCAALSIHYDIDLEEYTRASKPTPANETPATYSPPLTLSATLPHNPPQRDTVLSSITSTTTHRSQILQGGAPKADDSLQHARTNGLRPKAAVKRAMAASAAGKTRAIKKRRVARFNEPSSPSSPTPSLNTPGDVLSPIPPSPQHVSSPTDDSFEDLFVPPACSLPPARSTDTFYTCTSY
eukprot:4586265-Amphidinium_carterae.1